jgi:hypothetical protein
VETGLNALDGWQIFILSITSIRTLGPTQSPTQWVLGAVYGLHDVAGAATDQ